MAPLTDFRYLLLDPRSPAGTDTETDLDQLPDSKVSIVYRMRKMSSAKASANMIPDEASSLISPSRQPYMLPTDALPLPPIDFSTLDPTDDSMGRDFSLTCIRDLRGDDSQRAPDECFLVPKHAPSSDQIQHVKPMHLGAPERVIDQYHRSQAMLFDDCALRSLFAVLVLALVILALLPLDWAWFTPASTHQRRGCGCACGKHGDEETALPYRDDVAGEENVQGEPGSRQSELSALDEKQQPEHHYYEIEPPAKA